ncbi:MAG: hypothetical protein ABJH68_01080 [Ilumatobacter sp.]|uniref:hypothetical protein n=1 Tax=Ilumatobacter sp. TaxID=1967498 RepID=UPI003297DA44
MNRRSTVDVYLAASDAGDSVNSGFGFLVAVVPTLMFGAVVALVVFLIIRGQRIAARQRARAIALAAHYGFLIDASTKGPPPQRFDAFGTGHSRKVTNQLWRPGSTDSVFDYTYTTGSGKNQTTHRRTCALVALPFDAPYTKIATENFFSTLGQRLGIRDIETESVRFNDVYRITSDDERFAITLLDSSAIDWLLEHIPNGPGSVTFELWGPWLLCISKRMAIDAQFGFLDWARSVPDQFPDVLTSLHPITEQSPPWPT